MSRVDRIRKVVACAWICAASMVGGAASAEVYWEWSFGTEAGSFVTDGTLVDGAALPGAYTLLDFTVTSSQFPANLGSWGLGDYSINQPDQGFDWDGGAPAVWWRSSGTYTNGSNFFTTGAGSHYLFAIGLYALPDPADENYLYQQTAIQMTPVPALEWVGGGSDDLFDEANWILFDLPAPADTVNVDSVIGYSARIDGAQLAIPQSTRILLGDGARWEISNSLIEGQQNNQNYHPLCLGCGGSATIVVRDTSQLTFGWAWDIQWELHDSAQLRSTNGNFNLDTGVLGKGSTLHFVGEDATFVSEGIGVEDAEGLVANMFVDGEPAELDWNIWIYDDGSGNALFEVKSRAITSAYTDRISWAAAAVGVLVSEDFDALEPGSLAVDVPHSVGLLTVEYAGRPGRVASGAGSYQVDGTNYLFVNADGSPVETTTLTFPHPVTAFGMDFVEFEPADELHVTFSSGVKEVPVANVVGAHSGFIGWVSDTPFTRVVFTDPYISYAEGGIDNVSFVPEPSAELLAAAALLALARVARARRRAAC